MTVSAAVPFASATAQDRTASSCYASAFMRLPANSAAAVCLMGDVEVAGREGALGYEALRAVDDGSGDPGALALASPGSYAPARYQPSDPQGTTKQSLTRAGPQELVSDEIIE
ncbi:MAG: hypothetical protein ACFE0R_06430 [Salinarimonas sp.]